MCPVQRSGYKAPGRNTSSPVNQMRGAPHVGLGVGSVPSVGVFVPPSPLQPLLRRRGLLARQLVRRAAVTQAVHQRIFSILQSSRWARSRRLAAQHLYFHTGCFSIFSGAWPRPQVPLGSSVTTQVLQDGQRAAGCGRSTCEAQTVKIEKAPGRKLLHFIHVVRHPAWQASSASKFAHGRPRRRRNTATMALTELVFLHFNDVVGATPVRCVPPRSPRPVPYLQASENRALPGPAAVPPQTERPPEPLYSL